jgi:hypothetical protein
MITSNFDQLVDELTEVKAARQSRAELWRAMRDSQRRSREIKKSFDHSISELGAMQKAWRREERDRCRREARERRQRFLSLRDKATQLYKSNRITGDELCLFEANWNRAAAQLKHLAQGAAA